MTKDDATSEVRELGLSPTDEPPDGASDCDCTACLCERIDETLWCLRPFVEHRELHLEDYDDLCDEVRALLRRAADGAAPLPEVHDAPDYVPPFDTVPPGTDDERDIPF